MAEDQGERLAVAAEAVRLHNLAIQLSEEGERESALPMAEEAVKLYRTLAVPFPALFGTYAEQADALVAAIRGGRPSGSTARPIAAQPREPEDETTVADVSGASTGGLRDGATAVATPRPGEPPDPPASADHRSRPRGTTVAAAVVVVLLGASGAAGWALLRPHPPAPVAVQPPPAAPAAIPARPWTATARTDVAPTGVTLRSAPSTAGARVGRLSAGAEVQIQCGEIGHLTSTDGGERSSSWLRTTAGAYLAAINVEFRGPDPVTNCNSGQPPVPVPHHG